MRNAMYKKILKIIKNYFKLCWINATKIKNLIFIKLENKNL